jgi:hypothetical protein
MFGHSWYFSTIRKYVVLMGTLINDIRITRTDKDGKLIDLIKVPLSYAPKEKMLTRIENDPNIDRPFGILLPRISFEMISMSYDGSRKLPTINRISSKDTDANKLKYQYNPVPYNIQFRAYVYVKNAEDGTKIIEQILPFFTPEWTSTVKLIPEMDVIMDIPIVLDSISIEDAYTPDFAQRRALIWNLDFTLKGYIYGPIKKSGIIKFANTTFYLPNVPDGQLSQAINNTDPSVRVTVQPGLTANGEPTSNASLSIPRNEIEISDDFGFIIDVEELSSE